MFRIGDFVKICYVIVIDLLNYILISGYFNF